ncbi:MAG: hypothetical protein K0A90_05820, partial [Methanosarcinaceae archaeon]|nr:hypothetical protein [Methanosarcinaceae archaeon]
MSLEEVPYLVSGGCTMCHNNWDNRERFGLGDYYLKQSSNGIYITKNAAILPWTAGLSDANKTNDNSAKTGDIKITLFNVNAAGDETPGNINATVRVEMENWHGENSNDFGVYNIVATGVGNVTFDTSNESGSNNLTSLKGDYFKVVITNNGTDNITASIASLYGAATYNGGKKGKFTNLFETSFTSATGVTTLNLIGSGETVDTDDLIYAIAEGKSAAEYALHTTWLYNSTRLDKVWGDWSGISPAPMQYVSTFGRARPDRKEAPDGYDRVTSCDNAANGMCHITLATVGLSMEHTEWKKELPGTTYTVNGKNPNLGSTTYFTHDMKLTTTEYAAKPVKLCGACHITQMPPMNDNGEPIGDLDLVQINTRVYAEDGSVIYLNDKSGTDKNGADLPHVDVTYHSPTSWAHQTVPCIRCHSHAGVGAGVTIKD